TSQEHITALQEKIKEQGYDSVVSYGQEVVMGILGVAKDADMSFLTEYVAEGKIHRLTASYILVSRQFHPADSCIQVGDLAIGGESFITMAGPCSVESREQIFEAARMAAKGGAKVLRGGAFKPRT